MTADEKLTPAAREMLRRHSSAWLTAEALAEIQAEARATAEAEIAELRQNLRWAAESAHAYGLARDHGDSANGYEPLPFDACTARECVEYRLLAAPPTEPVRPHNHKQDGHHWQDCLACDAEIAAYHSEPWHPAPPTEPVE